MENFNITKALKYAPKGLKLYSSVLGEVEFSEVAYGTYPIQVKLLDEFYIFTEHGRYLDDRGECTLFPSKDHRTWDNWQDILFPQSIGSVCAFTGTISQPTMFLCTSNGTVFRDNTGNTWDVLIGHSGNYLKSSRYATPEESKQFFDELKANGYEWNGENVVKTTSTFKVGDWVVKKDGSSFFNGSNRAKITNIASNGQHWFDTGTWLDADRIRHWTIEDVKDGDVLAYDDGSLAIFSYRLSGLDAGLYMSHVLLTDKIKYKQTCAISNVHPATREQCNILFAKLKEAGCEWDSYTKLVKKIKFDVNTLKPFDKVLIRDYETFKWGAGLFAYYKEGANRPFGCNSATWEQCVPYNDDTKHLIGTTDDAPEFYKVWE